ncbi:hypothetical protein ELM59_10655 [Klebsiella pneumoniae]|nr:hypothetical protein [Klebsiella pneumoniae]
MCAGGSAHEMWQGVMRFIMQSNALKPFKKESKRILRCRNQNGKKKPRFKLWTKRVTKPARYAKIYATHFFVTGYEKE